MTATHFDDVAAVYDETLPHHVVEHYLAKRSQFVLRSSPPPGRLLDVGCGTGALAARLAGLGYAVVGLDPSPGMLEVMRERAPEVEAVQGSGAELPFADGEFDLSLSVATMHHLADASGRDELAGLEAEMVANALDGCIAIGTRILREQLPGVKLACRIAADRLSVALDRVSRCPTLSLRPRPRPGRGCCCSTGTRWPTARSSRSRWRTSRPRRASTPTRSSASPRC
jgi:SAM-dependent methyltransferase